MSEQAGSAKAWRRAAKKWYILGKFWIDKAKEIRISRDYFARRAWEMESERDMYAEFACRVAASTAEDYPVLVREARRITNEEQLQDQR